MPSRDAQTVILSRQTILMVTAVGVGLLTLCYVLGVQVGKQSAAMRRPAARGAGEDLLELPAGIDEQLKALEKADTAEAAGAGPKAPAAAQALAPEPKAAPPVEVRVPPAPKEHAEPKGEDASRWTLQLISTPDQAEAQRMALKVRAAGFPAAVITDKGLFKVRLTQPVAREAVDSTAQKLKNRGFKPFPMKAAAGQAP